MERDEKNLIKRNKKIQQKLQKSLQKKEERRKQKEEEENKKLQQFTLEKYIGRFPKLCQHLSTIKKMREIFEKYYCSYQFNIKCVLNFDILWKFISFRNGDTENVEMAYHGTRSQNDDSIINRGLIVGGEKGVKRLNGAAYGRGIYCSPELNTACSYAAGSVFACLIRKDFVNRHGSSIYVVPKDYDIVPLYLASIAKSDQYYGQNKDGKDIEPIYQNDDDNDNEMDSNVLNQKIVRFIPNFEPLNKKQSQQRKIQRKWSSYHKLNKFNKK